MAKTTQQKSKHMEWAYWQGICHAGLVASMIILFLLYYIWSTLVQLDHMVRGLM